MPIDYVSLSRLAKETWGILVTQTDLNYKISTELKTVQNFCLKILEQFSGFFAMDLTSSHDLGCSLLLKTDDYTDCIAL